MKLDVQFYKQESRTDCGPVALKMVLDYFGWEGSRDELINLVDPREKRSDLDFGYC